MYQTFIFIFDLENKVKETKQVVSVVSIYVIKGRTKDSARLNSLYQTVFIMCHFSSFHNFARSPGLKCSLPKLCLKFYLLHKV